MKPFYRLILATAILTLAALACGQAQVGEVTPAPTAITVIPSSTTAPIETQTPPVITPTLAPVDETSLFLRGALAARLGVPAEDLQIVIERQSERHAAGTHSQGGRFLAVQASGQWTIVHEGQGTPACADIDPHEFPQDMVPQCLDAAGSPVARGSDLDLLRMAMADRLGLPAGNLAVTLVENTGELARGTVTDGSQPGSGYFLAARVDASWLIVFDGQATPPCELVAPYEFPLSMVAECLDAAGNLVDLGPGGAAADDPQLPAGDPDWRDPFSNPTGWPLYEDDHVRFEVEDGQAILTALNAESWDGWMLTWPDTADTYLEATFQRGEACSGLDRAGLVFRQSNPDEVYVGYLLGVSCDGRYGLRGWDGESFTTLIPWTASPLIPSGPGQSYRMGVWAEGDTLRLYVDGQKVAEVTDETYGEGKFGLFVAAANTPDFTVTVDEIAYWLLD